MTKDGFIATYKETIKAEFEWARDEYKLNKFMASVRVTLYGDRATWAWNSSVTAAVWKALGGKGKPALKALRALP